MNGKDFWKNSEDFTILNERFHRAFESNLSMLVTGPFGRLKGLFVFCDGVDEEN